MDANAFVSMVANLKKDGELLEPDDPESEFYEQAIDDAYETLASLINMARDIRGGK